MALDPRFLRLLATSAMDGSGGIPAPSEGVGLGDPLTGLLGAAGEASAMPEPPVYSAPPVAPIPMPNFLDRAAAGLASTPAYAPRPYESAGSAVASGLLSGLARGFGGGRLLGMQTEQANREATAKANATEADRNYANQLETWKVRLKKYIDDSGNVKIGSDLIGLYPALAPFRNRALPVGDVIQYAVRAADSAASSETMSTVSDPRVARVLGVNVGAKVKTGDYRQAYDTAYPKTNATSSPEDLAMRRDIILQGIANGTMDPNIELYGTNRDGLKGMLAEGAVKMGLDLATLRLNWAANKRGLSTANSPQQLRMRQAANNIPMLLDQMAGAVGNDGARHGGVLGRLNSSGIPWWNMVSQTVKTGTGHAGALKQYNILASKLAMEQAFIMSGGNQPPDELYRTLRAQYAQSDNPANILDALSTVEETVRGYQQSVSDVGPINLSTPYTPGGGQQNPFTAPGFTLGQNPPAGTKPATLPADPFAKWRRKKP